MCNLFPDASHFVWQLAIERMPPLIFFKREDIIPALLNDLGSDIPLSAHRIQGNNYPLNIQEVQQLWNGANLIRLTFDSLLGQHQMMLWRPSTNLCMALRDCSRS